MFVINMIILYKSLNHYGIIHKYLIIMTLWQHYFTAFYNWQQDRFYERCYKHECDCVH